MTNQMIVLNARMEMLKEGLLKPTGRMYKVTDMEGNVKMLPEPEEIHTYQTWKELGYQVQKGEKAICKLLIWKYAVKRNKETDEEVPKMFMKNAAFFSQSQVAPIELAESA